MDENDLRRRNVDHVNGARSGERGEGARRARRTLHAERALRQELGSVVTPSSVRLRRARRGGDDVNALGGHGIGAVRAVGAVCLKPVGVWAGKWESVGEGYLLQVLLRVAFHHGGGRVLPQSQEGRELEAGTESRGDVQSLGGGG